MSCACCATVSATTSGVTVRQVTMRSTVGEPFAEQQADVVPIGGEVCWSERFEMLHDGGDGRHGGDSLILREQAW